MSYCVQCGVKLADYHKACPLCNTTVINPNVSEFTLNKDYPQYRTRHKNEKNASNKMFTAILLTVLLAIYSIIVLFLDLFITKGISWSLYPLSSFALLWVGVVLPFFRKRNPFFTLFSIDSLAVAVFLLVLNLIISQNLLWAKFTTLAIALVWFIMLGIINADKVKKVLPIPFYYILGGILMTIAFGFLLSNHISILQLLIPINLIIFVLAILSYFIVTASVHDSLGLVMVLLFDLSIFCVSLNLLISKYLYGTSTLTWALLVIIVALPVIAILHIIRKGKKLRKFVNKRLHL